MELCDTLHISWVQLGNTTVLNNSAWDFRWYLTEKLSHSWLRHSQSEGRGCGQQSALCPHCPTCQTQLTAEAPVQHQAPPAPSLPHRETKIPSGSQSQAETYVSTKGTAAQMCGLSLCWCTWVVQQLTTPYLCYRRFQQVSPQIKFKMEQVICKG